MDEPVVEPIELDADAVGESPGLEPVAAPRAGPVAALPAPVAAADEDAPSALVPPDLATPLRAVAPEVMLCIPESLERDRGPLDVEVRFTPTPQGAFASGTEVITSWDDEQHTIASCIAEVFDEASFWPAGKIRFSRADYVFHFPDDAMQGLLGMRYSPYE